MSARCPGSSHEGRVGLHAGTSGFKHFIVFLDIGVKGGWVGGCCVPCGGPHGHNREHVLAGPCLMSRSSLWLGQSESCVSPPTFAASSRTANALDLPECNPSSLGSCDEFTLSCDGGDSSGVLSAEMLIAVCVGPNGIQVDAPTEQPPPPPRPFNTTHSNVTTHASYSSCRLE